ncbi:UBX domain-containing protein 1 [Nakaseomyces bracarensis]|uniref:UBX domain-containing protein 1 n=1 Tax=Nakaseomyces bracarensis TaxID=273131 RepID=A0ABR4NN82_9SACH
MSEGDEVIQQFMSLTNTSVDVAREYLEQYDNDLGGALNAYYASQMDPQDDEADGERWGSSRESPRPVEQAAEPIGSSEPVKYDRKKDNKFMSFSQMVKDNGGEDDEDDDDANRNTFAGGEASGLEVTDPNDSNNIIKDLLEKAKRGGQQLPNEEGDQPEHQFSGKGYRLGSSVDAASHVVEDNGTDQRRAPEKVTREITFWKEGFQVGDGELYRYDDPANSFYLNELNQGRAPLKLLNVEFGQEVDVNVHKKLEESYQPPKRKIEGFQGKGQRLGSPIPGDVEISTEPATAPVAKEETKPDIHEKPKGDTSIQIRYASGKREVLHCDGSDTISFLYDHVAEHTDDKSRQFNLNHAFPIQPIEKSQISVKEAGLANSVVVQRWI